MALLSFVVVGIGSAVLYEVEEQRMLGGIRESLAASAESEIRKVDDLATIGLSSASALAAFQQSGPPVLRPQTQAFLHQLLKNSPRDVVSSVYITFVEKGPTGKRPDMTMTRETQPQLLPNDPTYNELEFDWFTTPLRTKKPSVSEPYYDEGAVNASMVSFTVPVFGPNGDVLAIAGVDTVLGKVLQQLQRIQVSSSDGDPLATEVILASRKGALISHADPKLLPSKGREGKSLKDVGLERVMRSAEGLEGLGSASGRIRYWTTSPRTGWRLLVSVPREDALMPLYRLRDRLIIFGLGTAFVLVVAATAALRLILKPLAPITQAARGLAVGDAQVTIPPSTGDELGELAVSFEELKRSFLARSEEAQLIAAGDLSQPLALRSDADALGKALSAMQHELKTALLEVQGQADRVGEAGHRLAASAHQSQGAFQRLEGALSDIHDRARGLAEGVDALAQAGLKMSSEAQTSQTACEDLTASIDEAASQSTQQRAIAQEAARLAAGSKPVMSDLLRSLEGLKSEIAASSGEVHRLQDREKEIRPIVGMIQEIAGQTNLLALNAAIEAARAGHEGRGFAVVADEVRKLAERSGSAAKKIEQMLSSLSEDMRNAASAVSLSASSVQDQESQCLRVVEALDEVLAGAREAEKAVEAGSNRFELMKASAGQLTLMVQGVAAMSEQTLVAANTMEDLVIRATLQVDQSYREVTEQAGVASAVTFQAEELNHIASELGDVVHAFRLEKAA